jgi:anti-sigma factor RsiW
MSHAIAREELMAYLDGELGEADRRRVDAHLAQCTECHRELVIFRELKGDLGAMRFREERAVGAAWDAVARRIMRPAGWVLLVAGVLVWAAYAVWAFATAPTAPWEKLMIAAIAVGVTLLLASVGLERLQDWRTDPYRDIEK